MIKRNYPLRILTMLPILTALLSLFTACAAKDAETDPAPDEVSAVSGPEYTEFSDLSGKTVSMLTGAPFEELVLSKAPDVSEFTFFGSMPDMLLALKAQKTASSALPLPRAPRSGRSGRRPMIRSLQRQSRLSGINGPVRMRPRRSCRPRTGREKTAPCRPRYAIL